jgi:hypothetical protein
MDRVLAFTAQHPGLFLTTGTDWFILNWHVMQAFEQEALAVIGVGREHYSARTIVENLVHESVIREVASDYKIGNHHAPDLARAFVVLHPEHIDFFEYRRENTQAFRAAIAELEAFPFLY